MFCEYCSRLFSFKLNVETYEPPEKRLGGVFGENDHVPQLKITGSDIKAASKEPDFEVYQDGYDLFAFQNLWWQVPIGRDGLKNGITHSPYASCQICTMIFGNVSSSLIQSLIGSGPEVGNAISFVYQLKANSNPLKPLASTRKRRPQQVIKPVMMMKVWIRIGNTELLPMAQLKVTPGESEYFRCDPDFELIQKGNPISQRAISSSESTTSDFTTLSLAASWIRHCNREHKICQTRKASNSLPSRLIDIGTAELGWKIRIYIPSTKAEQIAYTTLSYRWPSSPKVLLTQDSLAKMQQEIPYDLLPKCSQDAIRITHFLGLRYIWIDALCIIQDLASDWSVESANMGNIYRFSYCTISAIAGGDGCFVERSPLKAHLRLRPALPERQKRSRIETTRPKSISQHSTDEGNSFLSPLTVKESLNLDLNYSELTVQPYQTDLWATEVDRSPLSRRAWCFQERLLSNRILYFGRNQIFWECSTCRACESQPQQIPKALINQQFGDKESLAYLRGFTFEPFEEHWDEIVEFYTDTTSTRPGDKLVAISGLVKTLLRKTSDSYHAGLWRKTFAMNLLWHLPTPQRVSVQGYRAPSWSWASVDGRVGHLREKRKSWKLLSTSISKLLSVHTVGLDGLRSSTGQIKDGSCRILGKVRKCIRYERSGPKHGLILVEEVSRYSGDVEFFPDTTLKVMPTGLACLGIVCYLQTHVHQFTGDNAATVFGLVIEPTAELQGEYRRIGAFRWDGEHVEEIFEDAGAEAQEISII